MLNVNIGGTKGWHKVDPVIKKPWKVLDVAGQPEFKYDLNSGAFFPFGDGDVDNYYSSHTLEHISPELIEFVLNQMHRTLKPGGLVRVVVPDVALAIRKYANGDAKWLHKRQNKATKRHGYPETMLGNLMLWFYSQPKGTTRSGHNTVFDWETLEYYFKRSYFRNIRQLKYGVCCAAFKGMDFPRHEHVSLYLEAEK